MAYEVGPAGEPARLLTMPAWRRGEAIGVKIVNVFPGNAVLGLGSVSAVYMLFDGRTGAPRAIVDGEALTHRRTAAASALASTYLSRPESRVLLVVGTGQLAPHLATAHCQVRAIARVLVWGRSASKAQEVAGRLRTEGLEAETVDDLPAGIAQADIVTCATTSTVPLIRGRDVRPGTHVDLVGAFTPQMRESDDDLIGAADVYVDTRAGALAEAGDLLQAAATGSWSTERIVADLHELCSGHAAGRTNARRITVFKSVGAAMEDLVGAELVAWAPAGESRSSRGGS